MLRHLLIAPIQDDFRLGVLGNTCFEIIRYENPCHAAKVFVGVYMCRNPRRLRLIQKSLNVTISAVRQHGDKHISVDNFAGRVVGYRGSLSRPVHFHKFTGLARQMHGCFRLSSIFPVILLELRELVWRCPAADTLVAVFQPQQLQRDAGAHEFSMNPFVIRHHEHRFAVGTLLEQQLRQFSVAKGFGVLVTQLTGRRTLQNGDYCLPRCAGAVGYLPVVETHVLQSQDFSVVGHLVTSLNLFTHF
jgi:hypothetical protein